MKKLLYISFFFFPVIVSAQFNLYKDSPLDYAWKYVGYAGFSASDVWYTSLAFSLLNNQPYVAYQDNAYFNKATVMMFNGTDWVNVGNAGFSAGESFYVCLALSPSNNQII